MTTEEWRTIPDFPTYEINRDGDIRNKYRPRKKLTESFNGSYYYTLWKNGKSYKRTFWPLVCQAFPDMAS